jgi:hypothetical protein
MYFIIKYIGCYATTNIDMVERGEKKSETP